MDADVVVRNYVTVGQSRVGEGKVRVLLGRSLQQLGSFLEVARRSLVPEISALQIELISLVVARVLLGNSFRVVTGKAHTQLVGDRCGDLLLSCQQVRHLP